MMSRNEPQLRALGWIADGLAGSDPRLASMLDIFSRLAAGEEMPAREKIRVRRVRAAARRPRLGWRQAMLLLWVVITAGMIAVALALSTSSHSASCIQSLVATCPSPATPQHAEVSHVMSPNRGPGVPGSTFG
jgi:hypothetical protein